MPTSDGKKPPVPKFSSFKPKRLAGSDVGEGPAEADGQNSRSLVERNDGKPRSGGERKRRRHRSRESEDPSRARRHRHEAQSGADKNTGDRSMSPGSHTSLAIIGRAAPHPAPSAVPDKTVDFVIDTEGDPLISMYGIDRYRAPRIRREPGENVLGADGRLIIHRDGPVEEFSLRPLGSGSFSARETRFLQSKTRRIPRDIARIKRTLDGGEAHEETDFIAFDAKKKAPHVPELSEDEADPDYRSITGKAKPHEYSDSDVAYGSESEASFSLEITNNPLRQRNQELSRRVKENPEDIETWLSLVKHQDLLMEAGSNPEEGVTEGELKSFAEVKISMYEAALPHARDPLDRERLLVGLMKEGTKVWEKAKIAKRWSAITADVSKSLSLWLVYMDFLMSTIASFEYPVVLQAYIDRLQHLRISARAPDVSSVQKREEVFSEIIYVFLRATRFMFDSGYTELAVAAWQALLELNLMSPGDGVLSSEDSFTLDTFQEFWEAEVPRLGEDDAKGWRHFVENSGQNEPAEQRAPTSNTPPAMSRDVYKAWALEEQRRARASRMPARTMDDGTDDDPYRLVMFSDIEKFLFHIPADTMEGVQEELIDAYLLFCQLPTRFGTGRWTAACLSDPFISKTNFQFLQEVTKRTTEPEPSEKSNILPQFASGRVCLVPAPPYVWSLAQWRQIVSDQIHDGLGLVEIAWVRTLLHQLVVLNKVHELAMYYFALEWLLNPESIRTTARSLIKIFPVDMDLYCAYAWFESANKNSDAADKVFSASTGIQPDSSQQTLLWLSWAWIELAQSGSKAASLRHLIAGTEDNRQHSGTAGPDPTPAQVMHCRRVYADRAERLFANGKIKDFVQNAQCLALLAYITVPGDSEPTSHGQGNISAAMASISDYSDVLDLRNPKHTSEHERLLLFAAALLALHISRGPFRRAFVRQHLRRSIERFPRNIDFLMLLGRVTADLHIRDEFHNILEQFAFVNDSDSVESRTVAIERELGLGRLHATQAAFEKAVTSEVGRSSTGLWLGYIRFCATRKELRAKAKTLYYRAVAGCPWHKGIAMEAFVTLARDMQSSELRDISSSMITKGLRLHVDMDEFAREHKRSRR